MKTTLAEHEKKHALPERKGILHGSKKVIDLLRALPILPTIVLLSVVLAALLASFVAPYDPNKSILTKSLLPPFWQEGGSLEYILGTDQMGRDILSRIIFGARVSLTVALVAIALGGTTGTILGLVAGYFGGKVDSLIMRATDTMLALPYILIAIMIVAVFGASLTNIIVIIALSNWAQYARMVRGQVLSIKERDFVALAIVAGAPVRSILFVHILPNVANTLIVLCTLNVGTVILFEAALSFLGLGVPSTTPTWGLMLSTGRQYLTVAWWLATFPGVAIALTVLATNLLGDWLRDRLDPELQLI